jgi:hypothetical protein
VYDFFESEIGSEINGLLEFRYFKISFLVTLLSFPVPKIFSSSSLDKFSFLAILFTNGE